MEETNFSDLYQMYMLAKEHISSREFSWCSKENKQKILERLKELEEDVYNRLYGFNPFIGLNRPISQVKSSNPDNYVVFNDTGKVEKV